MPIEYAIGLVLAVYLVGGLTYNWWIHRPRKPGDRADGDAGSMDRREDD